ncbi:MAG: CPBP family intramembrane metalloprotease [Oscillospiraceae bacterium]|nr:CPBP family intramembrane metalloprotease [Oscillospiraceae bacterium]
MDDLNLDPVPEAFGEPGDLAAAVNRIEARRCFSTLGLGAFVILAAATVMQTAASLLLQFAQGAWASESWVMWVLTFAPLYCVAMPVGVLIMRTVPAHRGERAPLGAGKLLTAVPICFFLMYAGNYIGILITSLLGRLKGGEVSNPLESFAMDDVSILVKILVMVILAPLAEEFIFRRVLIDRMRIYGEKTAVVTSALMFGLFHGNLSQFFYAFALGLVFGYIYVKTSSLRYSTLLHMFVNALGSVVAPYLLENAGIDKLAELDASALMSDPETLNALVTPGLLVFAFYALLLLVLSLLGLVLLCVNARRITFAPAARELPRKGRAGIVWGNVGMILLILGCLGMIVLTVLM